MRFTVKNSRKALALLLAAIGGFSLDAMADNVESPDSYAYLGVGVGYGRMNGEDFTNTNGDLTRNNMSWKAMFGEKLNSYLALEAQYIDFGAARRSSDRIQARGVTADVVVDFIKDSRITPYGKVGALFWQTDNRFNDISDRKNGTNVAYGLGVRFALNNALAIKTEYERFAMDRTVVDSLSATLQYNFL
jgi:opacity protein-like surface antigen